MTHARINLKPTQGRTETSGLALSKVGPWWISTVGPDGTGADDYESAVRLHDAHGDTFDSARYATLAEALTGHEALCTKWARAKVYQATRVIREPYTDVSWEEE